LLRSPIRILVSLIPRRIYRNYHDRGQETNFLLDFVHRHCHCGTLGAILCRSAGPLTAEIPRTIKVLTADIVKAGPVESKLRGEGAGRARNPE